ncbi:zinc finger protein 106-like isoform X2, partial [Leptotrombidium deliense]
VKYKEFSKYVAANFSKQLNSDATVKLESLPKELYNKILEQIIGDNVLGNENAAKSSRKSESTSQLIPATQIKKEMIEVDESSDDDSSSHSESDTNQEPTEEEPDRVVETAKKKKARKPETSLSESLFRVAASRAQIKSKKKGSKSSGKSDDILPVVKEFEELIVKEDALEKDMQKLEKDLVSVEKERKKADKVFEKAEKKFSENVQKLMQALMLCDTLNEARDKARENCSNIKQRIEDLEQLKSKVKEAARKLQLRKTELFKCVIEKGSTLTQGEAFETSDQTESTDFCNAKDTAETESNAESDKSSRKKKSSKKRLKELATELNIGGDLSPDETALPTLQTSPSFSSKSNESSKKSWKENYVTLSLNTAPSPVKSSLSFQETQNNSGDFSTTASFSESIVVRGQTSESLKKTKVTMKRKQTELTSGSSDSSTSSSDSSEEERKVKRPKVEIQPQPSTSKVESDTESTSSSSSDSSEDEKVVKNVKPEQPKPVVSDISISNKSKSLVEKKDEKDASVSVSNSASCNTDNELTQSTSFNAFHDSANSGHITMIKVHKDFVYISSDAGYLRKFNVNNLKNNLYFEGHERGAIRAFTLHKVTDALYTGCDDGILRHFDSKTGLKKDSFHLCCPITCMEEGKTVLYVGLHNGLIYRFGFMSNKIINSYSVSSSKLYAIKLLAENSEESRIIVCCANSISVRNSSNGSLLNAFPNSHNIGFLNVSLNGLIYFITYDNTNRGNTLHVRHEKGDSTNEEFYVDPRVTAFERCDDLFYFGTAAGRVMCVRRTKNEFKLEWIFILKNVHTFVTAFCIYGDKLLAAANDGTVVKVGTDASGPHCCKSNGCQNKPFARKEDLDRHMSDDHWHGARRGQLYQCHRDNCGSVMSSSEVRRPQYHQRGVQNYNNNRNYNYNYNPNRFQNTSNWRQPTNYNYRYQW